MCVHPGERLLLKLSDLEICFLNFLVALCGELISAWINEIVLFLEMLKNKEIRDVYCIVVATAK